MHMHSHLKVFPEDCSMPGGRTLPALGARGEEKGALGGQWIHILVDDPSR